VPFVEHNHARLFYRLQGQDSKPVLVFSHSLGVDHGQWDQQTADLLPHFRVLRYDLRGHGASDAPDGDYSIELLSRDVLAIADHLGIERFAFCGLSLGGMIGQWLAASTPDRLTHAVLANTSPRFADPGPMEARRKTVLESGMSAIADAVLGRFFSPGPLSANPPHVASTRRTLLDTNPTGYAGCCAAIRDMDQRALLPEIELPTLVVSGHHDVSTPWIGHGEVLASSIGGASVVHLPAAHLSNLERPRSFSAALLDFLLPADADDPIHSGLTVRRAALGEAHVDRSLATATDFNRDFQELITRYAWGSVWARPGLDPRTRRLLVLAITASLGRWEEFRLHLRAGLERELEPCDVKEVLLQTAIYAGVPAANTAFKMAAEETLAARV
jgi:3-oxoadipate enol-lactonase/4-carboxymuconolactone decarboxylase